MKRRPSQVLPIVAVDRSAERPLYRQIYDGYRDAIVERRVRPGQRLPSTRALSAELRVSRLPVLSAFEQLVAEGYLEGRVGSGTFVANALPDAAPPHGGGPTTRRRLPGPGQRQISTLSDLPSGESEPWLGGRGPFRVSEPALDQFPSRTWATLVGRHARDAPRGLLAYGDPMGHRPLREALAEYLRTSRALRCEAEQVMVVSGSQQALALAARVLLDPGNPVWMEEPGYSGARNALALAGARLVPVPVDEEGLDVAAGLALCPQARAAYVTPSHQYPLGSTMTAARRLELLEWARARGAWIIEDDYDSEYRYESLPVAALQGLDRDARVVYVGTFSKVLSPALRVGYLVLPLDLVPRFARVRDAADIFPATLQQAALAEFLSEGHFARHLRRMRLVYRERRTALVEALRGELGPAVEVLGSEAGMHLVARLPDSARDREIGVRAARQGVWAMPLSSCYFDRPSRRGLVLGYGGTSARRMPEAVRRLRSIIDSE